VSVTALPKKKKKRRTDDEFHVWKESTDARSSGNQQVYSFPIRQAREHDDGDWESFSHVAEE
jgi:hypothetical protein